MDCAVCILVGRSLEPIQGKLTFFSFFFFFGPVAREAGVVSWGLDNKKRCNTFWEAALKYSKYDFEYRLATVRRG
jgi:hypothetical protein